MTVAYDPASPEFRADPYPALRRLRIEDPVHRREIGEERFWILTRYEDCMAVLRDPRCRAERFPDDVLERVAADPESPLAVMARVIRGMMLLKDPPDHTRLRLLVNKAFTPRVVESLRPRLERVVDECLEGVRGARTMDVMTDLAAPLPLIAIAELLGLPPEDRHLLKPWSDKLVTFLDGTIRDGSLMDAAKATTELREYLSLIVERRRVEPGDDLISRLIAAHEDDDRLSEDELYGTITLLLAAGHETTTNLIGNGMLALLRHPDQVERLRSEPALIRSAVEELLRYDSPVQLTSRIPAEEMVIGGRTIAPGEEINTSLGAANRDPAVFPEPDRLDIGRRDDRHLAFGFGAHFCLGAALARLEGQIAIGTLVRRLPTMRLEDDKPEWRPGFVLRGLHSLPVRF
jgi:cytochrome P450